MKPDGLACYELAIAAMREQGVRSGKLPPTNETERRWAAEGPLPVHKLATVTA